MLGAASPMVRVVVVAHLQNPVHGLNNVLAHHGHAVGLLGRQDIVAILLRKREVVATRFRGRVIPEQFGWPTTMRGRPMLVSSVQLPQQLLHLQYSATTWVVSV